DAPGDRPGRRPGGCRRPGGRRQRHTACGLRDGFRPGNNGRVGRAAMILVIDNYDSFTFNLVQALQAAGADVRVVRNDAIDRAGVEALAADPGADLRGIVISPGPGDPSAAGV